MKHLLLKPAPFFLKGFSRTEKQARKKHRLKQNKPLLLVLKSNYRLITTSFLQGVLIVAFITITINRAYNQNESKRANKVYEITPTTQAVDALDIECKELTETKGDFNKADSVAWEAIVLAGKIHYGIGIANSYNYLAENEWYRHNENNAIIYYARAQKVEESIGYMGGLLVTLSGLADIYEGEEDFGLALFEERTLNSAAKLVNEENVHLQKEKTARQKTVIYYIAGVLLLAVSFGIFMYRSFLWKRKREQQLEQKNNEITDSINYALRIQQSILPKKEEIREALPESFVLFKPKDIVSGDFYFLQKRNGTTLLGVADCTGHGVPGALMSMVGMERLNDAAKESNHPARILAHLNKGIRNSLHQSDGDDSAKDGMDIALCAIEGALLTYSGANRPLWIVRNGSADIEEIKATKRAIGGFTGDDEVFGHHNIQLNKGDMIYLFSDGYADQFGGAEGKKFTSRKFKEMLLSVSNKPVDEQEKQLLAELEAWQQNEEQVDDILVIGVRA